MKQSWSGEEAHHDGLYFDGQTATPHPVKLQLDAQALLIEQVENAAVFSWGLDDILPVDPSESEQSIAQFGLRLRRAAGAERLTIQDPIIVSNLRPLIKSALRHDHERRRGRVLARLSLAIVAALISLGILIYWLLPSLADRLARNMPQEIEAHIGTEAAQVLAELLSGKEAEDAFCRGAPGLLAINELLARLGHSRSDLHGPTIRVRVVDSPLVNAFALPGGEILLMRGLIDAADHPNAFAGVLAHEIGHIVARDPVRLAIQTTAVGSMIALALGDITGASLGVIVAQTLISNGYSRDVERAADLYAHQNMKEAFLMSAPFAEFIEKNFSDDSKGALSDLAGWFSSHPSGVERLDLFKEKTRMGGGSALPPQQWADLKEICAD